MLSSLAVSDSVPFAPCSVPWLSLVFSVDLPASEAVLSVVSDLASSLAAVASLSGAAF